MTGAVRALAAAAILLLAAGATAAERGGTRPDLTISAAGDGQELAEESAPPAPPAPTTTAAPLPPLPPPTTTTTVPRPTTTKPAITVVNAPPKSRQPYSGGLEPRVPGGVRFPYQAGQTVWSATSNGMAMTIRFDTANPVAGAPVGVVLEATPPQGGVCCFFQFGRDDGVSFGKETVKSDGSDCATPDSSLRRVESTVTFNKAGRLEFFYQAASSCLTPQRYGVIYGFVDVGAGRSTSQGPSVPVLKVDNAGLFPLPTDPRVRGAAAFARDEDGYIAGFSVNWGDGSPVETFPGDPLGCMELPAGWPNASQRVLSATPSGPPPTHTYAAPALYTVTVTTWSTGCDGADIQKVSASYQTMVS